MTQPLDARNLFRALLFAITAFLLVSSLQIYSALAQDPWALLPYQSAKAQIEYPEERVVRVNTTEVEINVLPTIMVDSLRANPDPGSGPTGDLTLPEAILAINNTGPGYVVLFDLPPAAATVATGQFARGRAI